MLTHLTRLVSRPWSKARLLATCFSAAPHCYFAEEVRRFHNHVYEARWGETLAAIHNLLPLRRCLQAAWDIGKFCFNKWVETESGACLLNFGFDTYEHDGPCLIGQSAMKHLKIVVDNEEGRVA